MSIANEKQPLPRARMRRNGAVRLMDAAALAVLAGWLVLALGVWYPQYAADTAAAASPYLAALQEQTAMSLEELWHLTLLVMQGGGALFMFLGAALWRLHVRRHALPYGRQARRAVHTCRTAGAGILLVQGVLAYAAWHAGLQGLTDASVWTYVCVLGAFPLNYLLSVFLRYFGAPAAFAARRGVFRRV